MNTRVAAVLQGYVELTATERQEFVTEINRYIEGDFSIKRVVEQDIRKSFSVQFGPAPQTCPCCGK